MLAWEFTEGVEMNGPQISMKRQWTRVEVVLWFLALIVLITVGILVLLHVAGSWVLYVGIVTVFVVLTLRYGAELKRGESRR